MYSGRPWRERRPLRPVSVLTSFEELTGCLPVGQCRWHAATRKGTFGRYQPWCRIRMTPIPPRARQWTPIIAVVIGLLALIGGGAVTKIGPFHPGCTAYLESRPELALVPPQAQLVREDLIGDGREIVAVSGGNPGGIDSGPYGPAEARWDFTMPAIDDATRASVFQFFDSTLSARGWTRTSHSYPDDGSWVLGDLALEENSPGPDGSRAQSLVSWTSSWEITESVGSSTVQPPECDWDGHETGFRN